MIADPRCSCCGKAGKTEMCPICGRLVCRDCFDEVCIVCLVGEEEAPEPSKVRFIDDDRYREGPF